LSIIYILIKLQRFGSWIFFRLQVKRGRRETLFFIGLKLRTLGKEHRLRVFENRVLRKIFLTERDEVTGENWKTKRFIICILKWIFRKSGVAVRTGLAWLRAGTGGKLLRTR
jgi:hypothetical protein